MLIQQIISIFSSNVILSFFTEYIATKSIDKLWSQIKLEKPVEYQLIEALEESLENFCKLMEWEYDSNAITDTFICNVNSLGGISSQDSLKSVLENVIGVQVDSTQLDLWMACFNLSITHSGRSKLLNYLISNNIFKIAENLMRIETSIADIKDSITQEAMQIMKKMEHLQRTNSSSNDIFVSITSFSRESTDDSNCKKQELNLEYVHNRDNSAINIKPLMGYLDKLNSSEPITQISYLWEPFNWHLPSFDFKLVNNTNDILYVTEILFKNINSAVDTSPILIMPTSGCHANARHILVKNDGWGKIKNLRMRLSACPVNSKEDINHDIAKLSHELLIGDVEREVNIDISDVLLDYGLISSLNDLHLHKDILYDNHLEYNQHTFDFSKVYGEFNYEGVNYTGEIQTYATKFEAIVYLYDWNLAAMPAPPSYFYDVKFRTNGKNYNVYKSVSQVLNPKEHDRFVVTIGLDKSSYHEFEIHVVTNLGTIIFPNVTLHAFVPRSGIGFCHTSESNKYPSFLF